MSEKLASVRPNTEPYRLSYHVLHFLVREAAKLAFGLEVTGENNIPSAGRALIACDHRTILDAIFLSAGVKDREVMHIARHEWFQNRILGTLMDYFDAIPIHRDEITEEEVATIIKALEEDERLVGIFAESTRRLKNRTEKERAGEDLNQLAELQPGVAIFARKAKAPTVPAVITGLDSVSTYSSSNKPWDPLGDGKLANISRKVRKFDEQSVIMAIMRAQAHVSFGEPLDYPNSIKARKDFLRILAQTMQNMREESLSRS